MTSLTRVLINPTRRGGAKLLAHPEAMHAAVRAAFPPDIREDDESGRILWRVDKHPNQHVLYVVGPEFPDARNIVEQAGWSTRPPESADYGRFLAALMKGQRWRFELVANPVRSRTAEGSTRGKIVPLTAPGQREWLEGRSDAAGFHILEDNLVLTGRETLRFRKRSARRSVTISTARFAGILEVADPDALRHTLTHGIGRARAYGCGLLTLARP